MRVLVIHKGGIGDVVFALPLLKDLKEGLEDAHVTVMTHSDGRQVLEYCPHVDDLITLSDERERWSLGTARAALGGRIFDLAISTARSLRVAWLLRRLGIKRRIGFGGGPESILYTEVAPVAPFEVEFSARFQRLSKALALRASSAPGRLVVTAEAAKRGYSQLVAAGWNAMSPLYAVHAGGGWPTKRWPVEHIVTLAGLIAGRGGQLALQGGPGDAPRVRAVLAACGTVAIDASGDTISDAIAKAPHYTAAVGIDSGLSHAMAACAVPTVFLFGPNEPASVRLAGAAQMLVREGLECRPCNRAGRRSCPRGHHRCMEEHLAEHVIDALDELSIKMRSR